MRGLVLRLIGRRQMRKITKAAVDLQIQIFENSDVMGVQTRKEMTAKVRDIVQMVGGEIAQGQYAEEMLCFLLGDGERYQQLHVDKWRNDLS